MKSIYKAVAVLALISGVVVAQDAPTYEEIITNAPPARFFPAGFYPVVADVGNGFEGGVCFVVGPREADTGFCVTVSEMTSTIAAAQSAANRYRVENPEQSF